ncbi:MAG: respiratory nitrate reductase subunit gamma [Phycisphaerae bacterium]
MPSLLLSVVLYVAMAIFVVGMGWRIYSWIRTPVPLKIVLTPGPQNVSGVLERLAGEFFGFRALAKADRSLWTPAWLFHVSLLLLFLGHLGGLVIPHFAQTSLGLNEKQFEHMAQIVGSIVGILAITMLLWLLIRRLILPRVRWISTFSDYFALLLLLLIIATGNAMRFMGGLNIVQAQQFVAGWWTLHPVAPPRDPMFTVHLLLVCALLIYIPFSKLVHIGGAVLLSPTLNQRNNPRQRRYVNTWDKTNGNSTASS